MVLVKTFYAHNELRNFSYAITDQDSGFTWVIDPYDSAVFKDYIQKNGLVLKGILNTHQHHDHIRGNSGLIEAFGTSVQNFRNKQTIDLGHHHSIEVMDTPGHTKDHQVFIWKQREITTSVFSGDSLFNAGVGNCHGGGDVSQLYDSTCLLKQLDDSTLLYPGHDYRLKNLSFAQSLEPENKLISEKLKELDEFQSENLPPVTLREEKLVNPFLRLSSKEIRQKVLVETLGLSENNVSDRELFKYLRLMRDQW
jgi:hydroxyacylglutathione hydrolase